MYAEQTQAYTLTKRQNDGVTLLNCQLLVLTCRPKPKVPTKSKTAPVKSSTATSKVTGVRKVPTKAKAAPTATSKPDVPKSVLSSSLRLKPTATTSAITLNAAEISSSTATPAEQMQMTHIELLQMEFLNAKSLQAFNLRQESTRMQLQKASQMVDQVEDEVHCLKNKISDDERNGKVIQRVQYMIERIDELLPVVEKFKPSFSALASFLLEDSWTLSTKNIAEINTKEFVDLLDEIPTYLEDERVKQFVSKAAEYLKAAQSIEKQAEHVKQLQSVRQQAAKSNIISQGLEKLLA